MDSITIFDMPDIILEKIASHLIIDDIANLAEIKPKMSYLINYCRGGLELKYIEKNKYNTTNHPVNNDCSKYRNIMEYAFKPIIVIDIFKYICISQDVKLLNILLKRNAFNMIADTLPKSARLLMKYCIQYIGLSLAINDGQLFAHIYKSFNLNNQDLIILWKNIKLLYNSIGYMCTNSFKNLGHYTTILESVLYNLVITYGLRIQYIPKTQRSIIKEWLANVANTPYYSSKKTQVLQLICSQ